MVSFSFYSFELIESMQTTVGYYEEVNMDIIEYPEV